MSFFDQAMTMKSAAGWPFPLRIVVATMDAYCKYKAGRLQGAARRVLDKLRTKLALVDESEAYALDQAVAGLGGKGAFETLVAFGDWHQRLEEMNPAFTRVPWVSGAPGEVDPGESQDEDRWGTGGDDPKNSKKTPNAKRRPLQEFLQRAPSAELTHSKRFGYQVTNFLSLLMPFAANFVSDPNGQDSTWLWHVFYDGLGWKPSAEEKVLGQKGGKGATGPAQSRQPAQSREPSREPASPPVGWHEVLFKCLLAMCLKQEQWVKQKFGQVERKDFPFIMIICPMARVAAPIGPPRLQDLARR